MTSHDLCMEDEAYARRYECYIRLIEHGHTSDQLRLWLALARHDVETSIAEQYEKNHLAGVYNAL